ncbi:nuclear transport factor 2 family protein [Dyadobacter pollutisoli]|uniref:Nuclear transport factor 2 family protein n=1 Tax=Dyadobacter pollutisoli TaxID=2910158 RepID=A0A9E8NAW1_9BACT|nr:nuclear transport factor 2 family protein [Dyadobacter pollutisoli]WAC11022.1 nuclear transport factor 2 family protein [Dyadobacter pollutisoli]
MKFTLLLVILFGSFTIALAQINTLAPIDGTDCSDQFFKALLEEDANSLGGLISNDFTAIGFNGRIIDGEWLRQGIAQGYMIIESGQLSGTRTRTYGDVAVTSGHWNVRAKIENNNFQGEVAYMTVCVRSGGKWKVTAAQLTPIQ